MKCFWLRFLLLSTFAFWASGAAKYAHEALEHHGRDASVDDDDDDADTASSFVDCKTAVSPKDCSAPKPAKKSCPVCQMLAAMAVVHSTVPVFPVQSELAVGVVPIVDQQISTLHPCYQLSARDPPSVTAHI